MSENPDLEDFAAEWFNVAKTVVQRIGEDPEIVAMREHYQANGAVTMENRSSFIAIANRIKNAVIAELYGPKGSDQFAVFHKRWRHWYDHKGVISPGQAGRRLTNEEHIVYSSTPEAEEFFRNMEK